MGKKLKPGKCMLTLVILLYSLTTLYPLIWLLIQSFKTDTEYYLNQFALPKLLQFGNYQKAWVAANFTAYFKNTILVTLASVLCIVVFGSLAAYSFARFQFLGKRLFQTLMILVMFVPATVTTFPVYFLVKNIHLTNTYAGLIGPYVCGAIPVAVTLMCAAFQAIPKEMVESAKIDGCSEWRIWKKIMMPMIKPTLATVFILNFMNIWNEYLWALVSISDRKMYTLSRGIVEAADKVYTIGYCTVFACMVLASFPVILVYIVQQKNFQAAILEGAVKG